MKIEWMCMKASNVMEVSTENQGKTFRYEHG
jgi:hypothetical protein